MFATGGGAQRFTKDVDAFKRKANLASQRVTTEQPKETFWMQQRQLFTIDVPRSCITIPACARNAMVRTEQPGSRAARTSRTHQIPSCRLALQATSSKEETLPMQGAAAACHLQQQQTALP
jgi:hypothetical protein